MINKTQYGPPPANTRNAYFKNFFCNNTGALAARPATAGGD
jgi:hypothetical protein